jgi:hypothetical protein
MGAKDLNRPSLPLASLVRREYRQETSSGMPLVTRRVGSICTRLWLRSRLTDGWPTSQIKRAGLPPFWASVGLLLAFDVLHDCDFAMASSLLRLVVVICTLWTFVRATCYWPPGNETYDRDLYEHQPCSNDTTSPLSTICCALNRTNISGGDKLNGRTNDECLPNGICRNRVLDHGTMQISYWRETCTSKDWKTGLCLDVCADNWTSGNVCASFFFLFFSLKDASLEDVC